jgi:D-alanyl-D-alanine carboxypeptidase
MSGCVGYRCLAFPPLFAWVRLIACLALLCSVAACGSRPAYHASTRYKPSRYYPPPGPPSDPWGPYIHEASGRFGVPEPWIRRVMRQESGGQEDVISWAGAMGLMQVMPETYDALRGRYNLGADPYDPHNNILAGTAYLREMYDRFGAPGFLAAYNAGPNRLDLYLNNGTPLPAETVSYVASIAPSLGPGTSMSGPLAVYAGSRGYATQSASRAVGGCDPDAAYTPGGPCTPARRPTYQPAVYTTGPAPPTYVGTGCDPDAAYDPARPCTPAPAPSVKTVTVAALAPAPLGGCDPDAAYDPTRPCRPAPAAPVPPSPVQSAPLPAAIAPSTPVIVAALPQPDTGRHLDYIPGARRPLQETTAQRVALAAPAPAPAPALGAWGIQVGAFANLATAQAAAENARTMLPDLLRTAKTELPATTPFGGKIAFRARLVGLSPAAATDACSRLSGLGLPCLTVSPRDTF